MEVRPGGHFLDLGTANGYVAFALARQYPRAFVEGPYIAEGAVLQNVEIARSERLSQANFRAYDGGVLPYRDGTFDGIVCRYSFHHYPRPVESIREIRRVLASGGFFLLSDPYADDEDASDFINSYQALVPDGHVRFYRRNEIDVLFLAGGFRVSKEFERSIRYPRTFDPRYQALIETTNSAI